MRWILNSVRICAVLISNLEYILLLMLKVYSIVLRKEFKMSDCNTFIIVELQKDASVLKVVNTAMDVRVHITIKWLMLIRVIRVEVIHLKSATTLFAI